MEFINYMRVKREGSAESSNSNALNSRRSTLGSWLSLRQPNPYICSTCSKTFPSLQALGGHQNAHKKDRILQAKRESQNLDNLVVPMANPVPAYGPLPVPRPAPGAGYGAPPASGSGSYYYHPYLMPRRPMAMGTSGNLNVCRERDLAAALDNKGGYLHMALSAAPEDAGDKAFGEDEDEVTSKRRLELNLRL